MLGARVVARFYANAISRNAATIIGIESAGEIAGFVMVTDNVKMLFSESLMRDWNDKIAFLAQARFRGLLQAIARKFSSKTLDVASVPELVYIAVDTRFRERGYAKLLLEAADMWFRKSGIERYFLNVHAENTAALRLYLNHGMHVVRSYDKNRRAMHTLEKLIS